MYLFVYSRTPLHPPPPCLVYGDRPMCVCWGGGVGLTSGSLWYLKRLSAVSSKNGNINKEVDDGLWQG